MKEKECPICHRKYTGYPAISRKDNRTEICSQCGLEEALNEWGQQKYLKAKEKDNV